MRATHTCDFNELLEFAENHMSGLRVRSEVEEHFFPECDKLVVFKLEEYKDEDADDYPLGEMIAAFLNYHKISECLVTGPEY